MQCCHRNRSSIFIMWHHFNDYNILPKKNWALMQRSKSEKNSRKSQLPVLEVYQMRLIESLKKRIFFLQIPYEHAILIKTGKLVELITTVLHKVHDHNLSSYHVFARYFGFWPPIKDNHLLPTTPFSNPFIWRITPDQLLESITNTGVKIYQVK